MKGAAHFAQQTIPKLNQNGQADREVESNYFCNLWEMSFPTATATHDESWWLCNGVQAEVYNPIRVIFERFDGMKKFILFVILDLGSKSIKFFATVGAISLIAIFFSLTNNISVLIYKYSQITIRPFITEQGSNACFTRTINFSKVSSS